MVELEWCVVPVRAPWGISWGVKQGGRTTLAFVNREAAEAAAIQQAKAAYAEGEPAAAAALVGGHLSRLWPPLTGRRAPGPLRDSPHSRDELGPSARQVSRSSLTGPSRPARATP